MNRKVRIIFFICIFIVLIIISFLYYKNQNLGNNINKSITDFTEYILNISSYEANITVEVNSNKNTNKYVIKQWYVSPNIFKQEVLEPKNIQGLIILYDGTNLKIQNTRLDLAKIYNNYEFLSDNILCLNSFIQNYKEQKTECSETENEIVVEVVNGNKYAMYQRLTMDKTGIPIKMEVMDENKKTLVYILYNEITINSTTKEDII